MSESSDSKKLTLIYLQQLFLEKTDKTHYIRMPEILSYLESNGIIVDRRTIYKDLKLLDYAGFEILGVQEKGGYKYHHPARLFDTNELKFLIDSVSSSSLLTETKSKELVKKIKSLGSQYDNNYLNRGILNGSRIRSMNDKVFHNLDVIYSAISQNLKLSFQYMRWTPQKKMEYFRAGKLFDASPYAISLNDNKYYLVAYDSRTEELRHYRIDRMSNIQLIQEQRAGKELFKTFNVVEHTQKTFGMFNGEEHSVAIEFPDSMAGVFIERFGNSASIRPSFDRKGYSVVRAKISVSPQFFGWILGLGDSVKILSPESVVNEFAATLKKSLLNYPSSE